MGLAHVQDTLVRARGARGHPGCLAGACRRPGGCAPHVTCPLTSARACVHAPHPVLCEQVGGDLPGGIHLRGLSGGERKRLSIAIGKRQEGKGAPGGGGAPAVHAHGSGKGFSVHRCPGQSRWRLPGAGRSGAARRHCSRPAGHHASQKGGLRAGAAWRPVLLAMAVQGAGSTSRAALACQPQTTGRLLCQPPIVTSNRFPAGVDGAMMQESCPALPSSSWMNPQAAWMHTLASDPTPASSAAATPAATAATNASAASAGATPLD
jgi:hypothetical protein